MQWIKGLFKLKEAQTTLHAEVMAAITAFPTMTYVIFVNPNILGGTYVGI